MLVAEVGAPEIFRRVGNLTFLTGGAVVLVVWAFGGAAVPAEYLPVTRVLAEILAVLVFALAWRFRRSRLAVAAVVVAVTNLLLRGPLAIQLTDDRGPEMAVLGLLLPLNLGVLALLRDRPVPRLVTAVHLGLIAAQVWAAKLALGLEPVGLEWADGWLELGRTVQASMLAFLIAGVFTVLRLAMRRSALETSMIWLLVASGLAVLGAGGASEATLLLTAGQLVLLLGLVEDSYRLAYHDELTGLPGRRALNEALRGLNGDYAIAMVDVDHFKRFNDRYGHETGDQALRMVAECMRAVGGGGRSYRYGGEEFAVLFAGSATARAKDSLDRLRKAIETRRFGIRAPKRPRKKPDKPPKRKRPAQTARVTVSIGAAQPNARRPTADDVLRAADRALYRAKKAGRNRLICS